MTCLAKNRSHGAAGSDDRNQSQKFIDTARELGADSDEETFKLALRKVATAPVSKAKKAARKPKG